MRRLWLRHKRPNTPLRVPVRVRRSSIKVFIIGSLERPTPFDRTLIPMCDHVVCRYKSQVRKSLSRKHGTSRWLVVFSILRSSNCGQQGVEILASRGTELVSDSEIEDAR